MADLVAEGISEVAGHQVRQLALTDATPEDLIGRYALDRVFE